MLLPKLAMKSSRRISSALNCECSPRALPISCPMTRLTAKGPIQLDSSCMRMFGCCPRHQVRMLVPDRGDPTTKIGLFIRSCTSVHSPRPVCARGSRELLCFSLLGRFILRERSSFAHDCGVPTIANKASNIPRWVNWFILLHQPGYTSFHHSKLFHLPVKH